MNNNQTKSRTPVKRLEETKVKIGLAKHKKSYLFYFMQTFDLKVLNVEVLNHGKVRFQYEGETYVFHLFD